MRSSLRCESAVRLFDFATAMGVKVFEIHSQRRSFFREKGRARRKLGIRMTKTSPRVCVLHIGGTIGMTPDAAGHLVPVAGDGFLERFLRGLPECSDRSEFRHQGEYIPEFDVVQLDPLLDSADMGPADWTRLAQAIGARYRDYTGFVVAHGTDTMVYTASALSFLLQGLDKPVILTGSQLSLLHPRTDGREHLVTSLILAGHAPIPEVSIYFAKSLLRGNRAQKVHNNDFVAFHSGNWPELARVGVAIEINHPFVRAPGAGLAEMPESTIRPRVVAVRLHPGMEPRLLARMLGPDVDGMVLETYGAGTAPTKDPALLDVLAAAIAEDDVVIVNISQCHGGRVQQSLYGTGAALETIGVVSGGDMTPEAALTKLYLGLSSGLSRAQVRRLMGSDLAGEIREMGGA
jgi:L-asparaginase